jgi:hypothetical protein
VALETPRAPQTSATVLERSLKMEDASFIFCSSVIGFLPPFLPRTLAASNPAIDLSRRMSLSNSATAPKT